MGKIRGIADRIAAASLSAVMAAAMLTGCGQSAETKEILVVPKETEQETTVEGVADGTSVREQIAAPDSWQTAFSDGNISVKVDAKVIIPDVEGIKVKKVIRQPFTQEDYDTVNRVLLKGAKLWDRDWEAMGASALTKKELEARIAELEGKRETGIDGDAPYGGKKESLNEQIAAMKELKKTALDEPVIVEIPGKVEYTENPESYEDNSLSGIATVDGTDYYVSLQNWAPGELGQDFLHIERYNLYESDQPSSGEASEEKKLSAKQEEFIKTAQGLMSQMGLDDFEVSGSGDLKFWSYEEDTEKTVLKRVSYRVCFTRTVDGVPETYTIRDSGSMEEDEEATSWPREMIEFEFDDEGLVSFSRWESDCLEELSGENVSLLPFSEIQDIFEKMICKEYDERIGYSQDGQEACLHFTEARLGYMRVREKGKSDEGMLIPVWDFFGTEEIIKPGSDEARQVLNDPYDSKITINAMDGTVISRDVGY